MIIKNIYNNNKKYYYVNGQLLTALSNEEIDRINRMMSKNVEVKELMEKMSVYSFDLEEIYCDYCETCGGYECTIRRYLEWN